MSFKRLPVTDFPIGLRHRFTVAYCFWVILSLHSYQKKTRDFPAKSHYLLVCYKTAVLVIFSTLLLLMHWYLRGLARDFLACFPGGSISAYYIMWRR